MSGGFCLTHGKLVQLAHPGSHTLTTVVTSANATLCTLSEATVTVLSNDVPCMHLAEPEVFLDRTDRRLNVGVDSSPIGGAVKREDTMYRTQFLAPLVRRVNEWKTPWFLPDRDTSLLMISLILSCLPSFTTLLFILIRATHFLNSSFFSHILLMFCLCLCVFLVCLLTYWLCKHSL